MSNVTFKEFFKTATGYEPYPYQEELASRETVPEVIKIPTGAGKTESAVIALYLWRVFNNVDEGIGTPRRLIYCLPMRVLVEQVLGRVRKWVKNLNMGSEIDVVTLMGGDTDRSYRLHPEKNAIIVGTQDMLLSRALNRGYSSSPFQWPVEFALLNNDCMWIMDEIQLMDNGFTTSVQLEQFREKFKTFGYHKTVWMSATVNKQWFETTLDSKPYDEQFGLTKKDLEHKLLKKRNAAKKVLKELELPGHKDEYTKADATTILEKCGNNTTSLIIVNTVKRAQSLFKELEKLGEKDLILIHSRFRQKERQDLNKKIQDISDGDLKEKRIIISTQVLEAGVDISSTTMITEMSPWPSMVQRFGRCNRKGDDSDATVYFIRLKEERQHIPYDSKDMQESEKRLDEFKDKSISPINMQEIEQKITHETVIRESDMIGLFDTGSDLSGGYTDVSKFIRSLDETSDVSVIWRNLDENKKPPKRKIMTEELCSIPISGIKDFIKKRGEAVWTFSTIDGSWDKTKIVQPGRVYLIDAAKGGYSEKIGWDLISKETKEIVLHSIKDETSGSSDVAEEDEEESHGSDSLSQNRGWITLNDHTSHVIKKTQVIINEIKHLASFKDILEQVAKYHDMGKAHQVFQATMIKNAGNDISHDELWAKRKERANHSRKYFRHELASALMFLKLKSGHESRDLIAYLIASHHGKVRLSIRSPFPSKETTDQSSPDEHHILGIPLDKKESVKVFLSDKHTKSKASKEKPMLHEKDIDDAVEINASIAKIGQTDGMESWLQMTLRLLDEYGPFRLAYLEAIIRGADSRASQDEENNNE